MKAARTKNSTYHFVIRDISESKVMIQKLFRLIGAEVIPRLECKNYKLKYASHGRVFVLFWQARKAGVRLHEGYHRYFLLLRIAHDTLLPPLWIGAIVANSMSNLCAFMVGES